MEEERGRMRKKKRKKKKKERVEEEWKRKKFDMHCSASSTIFSYNSSADASLDRYPPVRHTRSEDLLTVIDPNM